MAKLEPHEFAYTMLVVNNLLDGSGIIYYDDPNVNFDIPTDENPEVLLLKKERELRFRQLEGLSDEAKQIIRLIYNSPKEIFTEGRYYGWGGKVTKSSLRRFIRSEWKWPYRKIWSAFAEIKEWLRSL